MNTIYLKKLSAILLIANLGFVSLPALACQDGSQRLLFEQTIKQQQQAKATEAAKQHAAALKADQCNKQMQFGRDNKGT